MNSPRWSDDELLQELRAALQEASGDEGVIRAARAAFTWRTVDADIELLCLDAAYGQSIDAPVRSGWWDASRMLAFHGERMSVEIEIDEAGIVGQLTPPRSGRIKLVTSEGPQATTQADEAGRFTFPPPTSGPLRLDFRIGADRFVTEWVRV